MKGKIKMREEIKSIVDRSLKQSALQRKYELLTMLEIFEKEYPVDPINYSVDDYPESGYDENGTWRRYRKKPIQVTEEEYKEICEYVNANEEEERAYNKLKSFIKSKKQFSVGDTESRGVATIIKVFAWISIIGGLLYGLFAGAGIVAVSGFVFQGFYGESAVFSLGVAISIWAPSLLYGVLLLGFAKIIDLLQEIKNK